MNLFDLVSQDVVLTIRGKEAWGLCPFHQEKTASFSVNLERQVYYCFGCTATGDAITYLRKKRGATFIEAYTQITGQRPLVRSRGDHDIVRAYNAWKRQEQGALADELRFVLTARRQLSDQIGEAMKRGDFPAHVEKWHRELDALGWLEHALTGALEWWKTSTTDEKFQRWDAQIKGEGKPHADQWRRKKSL